MPTAGNVLRDARRRARLSQTDVAKRARVSQSVVSQYESGKREPSLRMLAKLVEATGHSLEVGLVPHADQLLGLPPTRLGRRLRRLRRSMVGIAASRGATNLRVFGSVARGTDEGASDVDLLVDLDEHVGVVGLIGLERELSALLGAPVDVVPARGLKPGLRDDVLAEAIAL